MDILTLCGALLGIVAIVAGFTLEGGRFLTLFQVEAIVIVAGGTVGAVMVQNTWARFCDKRKSSSPIVRKAPSALAVWNKCATICDACQFPIAMP